MWRWGSVGVLAFVVLVFAACSSPPSATGGEGDPVTGVLGSDGGILTGPDGVALGVPAGVLSAALTITLSRSAHPEVPFGDDVTPWGRSYRASSSEDAYGTLPTRQFLIALPVPEGTPTEHLALATLSPAADNLDGVDDAWLFTEGTYVPAEAVFVAVHPALLRGGDVVRLASAERFASPVAVESAAAEPSPPSLAPQQGCTGWFAGFEVDAGTGVSDTTADLVRGALDAALDRYRSLGFEPFLLELSGGLAVRWSDPPVIVALDCAAVRYRAHVQLGPPDVSGMYSSRRKTLTMITNSETTSGDLVDTAYHELFHSLQNRYLGEAETTNHRRAYFLEGSAVLAEAVATTTDITVNRDEYAERYVDTELVTDCASCFAPYGAQDFWKYVADQSAFGFVPFMEAFLGQGSVSPSAVDQVLQASFSTDLPERYQGWARNQTYDPGSCSYRDNAEFPVDLGTVVLATEASGLPANQTLNVGALNTKVFTMVLADTDDSVDNQLALVVRGDFADVSDDDVAVTVIEDVPALCAAVSSFTFEAIDGAAVFRFNATSEQPSTPYYVVVMNGRSDAGASGAFLVDGAPAITGTPQASPAVLPADQQTDVTFTLPFEDNGANIAKIHGRFEFENNPDIFDLTWQHDEAFVSGFTDQATGNGQITVAMIVYCSEQGTSSTVTATWGLEDDLGFKGEQESTTMTVDYSACTSLVDGTQQAPGVGARVSKR